MSLRFVTRQVHAWLDYPVAAALILMPNVLGLGETAPLAFWLSVVTGFAALALTILTDHQTGLIRVLPYKLHLAVDLLVGVTFLIAPLALGFTGLDAAFYWINGAAVVVVISLSAPGDALLSA